MRKASLSIDPSVDKFARRKQKLLEKKKKDTPLKGKGLAESSKEAEPDVGQKRARVEEFLFASQVVSDFEKIQLTFPVEASFVSEPKDILPESRKLLLPEDDKRLLSLGRRQASERVLHQAIQVLQGTIFMEREMAVLGKRNKESLTANSALKEELEEVKADREKLKGGFELQVTRLEAEKAVLEAEKDLHLAELSRLKSRFAELEDEKENCELAASTAESYKLMKEFLEHKGEKWDPKQVIRDYEELLALEMDSQGEGGEEKQEEGGDEEREGEGEGEGEGESEPDVDGCSL